MKRHEKTEQNWIVDTNEWRDKRSFNSPNCNSYIFAKKRKSLQNEKKGGSMMRSQTWIPFGELLLVSTFLCSSVSGNVTGLLILTSAIRGANLSNPSLKLFSSKLLCTNRSASGKTFKTCSKMEGPVNSNLLAPPTRQIAMREVLLDFVEGKEKKFQGFDSKFKELTRMAMKRKNRTRG
jgi:hypothetical protein